MKYLKNNLNGISPVVGVLLMIIITFLLAGVIALLVLGIEDNTSINELYYDLTDEVFLRGDNIENRDFE